MLRKEIVIGVKVRCIQRGPWFGAVGHIKTVGRMTFTIEQSDGTPLGAEWASEGNFELCKEYKTRPMTEADRKVGTKVICVYSGPHNGKVGYISSLTGAHSYYVKDDAGEPISLASWSHLSSWDVVIDELTAPPIEPAPLAMPVAAQEVIKDEKPCPAYYNGPKYCTCGRCNNKQTYSFR